MSELMDESGDELIDEIKRLSGGFYLDAVLDPKRPYDGQPHTDAGERGKTLVEGLTMRDIADCYIVGCFHASGLSPDQYPETVFELPWGEMDPIAVSQNMLCEVERRMGIFPNVPGREAKQPSGGH